MKIMRISQINNSYHSPNKRSKFFERNDCYATKPKKADGISFLGFRLPQETYNKLSEIRPPVFSEEHKDFGEKLVSCKFGDELTELIYQKFCTTGINYSCSIQGLRDKIVASNFAFNNVSYAKPEEKLSDVNNYISEHFSKITNAIRLMGEDTVLYATEMKAHRFEQFLEDLNNYKSQHYISIIMDLLLTMTNPTQSTEYHNLIKEQTEIEKKMRCNENIEFFELHEKNKSKIKELKEQVKLNKQNKNLKDIKPLYEEITELRKKEFVAKPMELRRLEEDMTYVKANISKLISNSIKDPQEKINLFYLQQTCSTIDSIRLLNRLFSDKSSEGKVRFKKFMLTQAAAHYSLNDSETNTIERFKLQESPYFTKLFHTSKTTQGLTLIPLPDFHENFHALLKTLSENPSPKEAFKNLPQNIKTKELFEEQKVDFKSWITFDPNRDVLKLDNGAIIRKVDMDDIKHSLFLGNQVSCCTAIGKGSRSGSAPSYIMNKFVQAIELIVDGTPVGNTMCYLAQVNDKHYLPHNGVGGVSLKANNELSLILDNMEVLKPYKDDQQYLKGFIEYAQKLAKNIGVEGIPIYAGHRNSFDMREYHKVHLNNLYILGTSGEQSLSLDSLENLFVMGETLSHDKRYYGDFYSIV